MSESRSLTRDEACDRVLERGLVEELSQLYEVRRALEGLAAYLAAERGATAGLKAYGPVFRGMQEVVETADPAAMYHHEPSDYEDGETSLKNILIQ